MEEWKTIIGFSNYEISSLGRVRSSPRPRTRGGIVKQSTSTDGRYRVLICGDSAVTKTLKVHRLVAIHFLPNLYGRPQVDHVNGDFTDNRVTNLRWCTSRQNKYNVGLRKDNKSGIKGVCFENRSGKWLVQVQNEEGKRAVRKSFKTKQEAIDFREKMVKIFYDPNFYRSA